VAIAWAARLEGKEKRMRPFFAGVLLALVLVVAAGYLVIANGLISARGDERPSGFERWAARISLNKTIAREAPAEPYPFSSSEAGIIEGAQLYAAHCSICHGNADGDPSLIASGFAIHAPQFAKHGVDDDPAGETYWKIEHGIHWTAMPAFGGRLTEAQIWNIAFFLKTGFEKLPPAAEAAWKQPVPEPTLAPNASASPSASATPSSANPTAAPTTSAPTDAPAPAGSGPA